MVQKTLIFKILILIIIFSNNNLYGKTIVGKAKIIDGDTIHIRENKIRLYGIDAPETDQECLHSNKKWQCGKDSTNFLKKITHNRIVECKINGVDKYKRYIGICFTNQKNLNKHMVKNGWAIAYRYYSKYYIDEELIAKKNKKGIWRGEFQEPYKFREK